VTFAQFERRCAETPDLELSPFYWNELLPMTTGVALLFQFILPMIRDAKLRTREQEQP
jgi:hypothetical protein